ncbi:Ig-like domain-containing protein [Rhodothermus marinus]|uniref:Ig-like domain-containing protein n=1 Tax=Rhodothermus marinus TaxID=29549 RepID=UPI0037C92C0B
MRRLMLLLTLALAAVAQAQDLEVVSTTPAHGSAGVDPTTAVSITFNKAINPADSLLIFPLDTLLQQQLTDPSRVTVSPDGKTITFNVTHQTDRDYTWVVHYVKGVDGSRLARRYVFHYTTAAATGPYTVSGQLVEMQGGPGKRPLSVPPRLFTFRTLSATRARPSASSGFGPFTLADTPRLAARPLPIQSNHLGNWYVALWPTAEPEGDPVRVAVSNPDGTFSIEYVRPGTYYLWAFFLGFDFESPLGFGAYDQNGDGEPDPLQISGDLSGLTIPVILLEPITALQAAQVAQLALATVAPDAQIVLIQGSPDENGRALSWGFTAYSPSQQTAYGLSTLGTMPAAPPEALPSPQPFDQMAPLPLDNMVDSDDIVAAYRSRFPAAGNTELFLLQAGQLARYFDGLGTLPIELYPLDPEQSIWLVRENRSLPTPLEGILEYSAAYDLSGNELAAYEPATAVEALQAAWQRVAPAKRVLQSDGIVRFWANPFDPYSGKASWWTVDLVAGGQALSLTLSNTLVTYIDTLDQTDWADAPKIPFPEIIDSDQAADTARAHNAAEFLNTHASELVFSRLEGGFLAEQYGLQIDPNTPLYALTLEAYPHQTAKRAESRTIAQASATYFINMTTGAFVGAQTFEPIGPFTARAPLQAVRDSLAEDYPGAELKRIFSDGVNPDGTASWWRYDAYQSDANTQVQVAVSAPEEQFVFEFYPSSPPTDPVADWPTLPESFIDSDEAMATAMANGGSQFLETHPNAQITMEGRAMPDRYPHLEGHFIWEIIFRASLPGKRASTPAQADSLVVLVDMQTGEVLPTTTAREALPERARLTLKGIYPNPASRTAVVIVQVPRPERIRLVVYNLLGQEVARLIDGPVMAGEHRLRWSVRALPTGLYLVRLQGSDGVQTLPVVVAH